MSRGYQCDWAFVVSSYTVLEEYATDGLSCLQCQYLLVKGISKHVQTTLAQHLQQHE